jgi:hypothetical protein
MAYVYKVISTEARLKTEIERTRGNNNFRQRRKKSESDFPGPCPEEERGL